MAVEVEEGDLGVMQRATKLLGVLNGNPAARRHLESALKAVDPNIKTTDEQVDEVLAPKMAEVNGLAEKLKTALGELEERKAKDAEDAERGSFESAFARLRAKEGLTLEGESEVVALMTDLKIADPEAAFLLWQRRNPPTTIETTPSYLPDKWNFQDEAVDNDVSLLWSNPQKWTDQMIPKVLADERREPARV